MSYTKFTFKEFRVCVRAVFAFGAGYKLGERELRHFRVPSEDAFTGAFLPKLNSQARITSTTMCGTVEGQAPFRR